MTSKGIVSFSFENKDISIQCSKNHKMKEICQIFAQKIGYDINSFSFLYNGNKINLELSFEDLALPNEKENNKIKIIVIKNEVDKNYCPFCEVKTSLKVKEVELITLSNNSIIKGINNFQNHIQTFISNCYLNSIKIQLQNVSYLLISISEQLENYNKNLQKSFMNITKLDNLKKDKNNLKDDKINKEVDDNKEKELHEKQLKELENKKKFEEEEKKKKLEEEEKKKKMEEEEKNKEIKKKLEEEEKKKKLEEEKKKMEQIEKEKKAKTLQALNEQKKQFQNDKLKKDELNKTKLRYTMTNPNLGYACTCTNLMILQQYIYVGTDFAEIPLILRNNGSFEWPPNSKLVFDKNFPIKGADVPLYPLKKGEEQKCIVKITGLGNLTEGEYQTGVYFNIKGSNCGDMMKMKIIIIKKEIEPKIKYREAINLFREEYNLQKEEYSDDDICSILESNSFDFEKAFMCIIGEIN